MRDSDDLHLMVAVYLVLMMLVGAAAWDWQLRHPELVQQSMVYVGPSYGGS
jgi:hypothetical protein